MFKKLEASNIKGQVQCNKQKLRNLRKSLIDDYPNLEPVIDDIIPQKGTAIYTSNCQSPRCQLLIKEGVVLFFAESNKITGPWIPTLRTVHQYPEMATRAYVDLGAIPFVMKGADIMCPGLTSPGGNLDQDFEEGSYVLIYAEGKEHCLGVGEAAKSRDQIIEDNEDIAFRNLHSLGDGLWMFNA
eukprot:TRINITY_DN7534_c0_g1_i1.p1 TRINITY_DN7534_c0_g1~~TRINITY_DN7534_c0_g1_i1.p1  ORF type:complete len:185 (-),score=30.42 TRINITY_DN7534_c0_g1_i1:44-598(-)